MNNYIFTVLYVILNAASVVAIHLIGNEMPIDLMIFLSSLYAAIFFHLINLKKIKSTYIKVCDNINLYIYTIVVFLVMWIVCFLIPIYYTPAILMFYATSIPTLLGVISLLKRKSKRKKEILVVILLAFIMVSFMLVLSKEYRGLKYLFLIIGAITAGVTMYVYSILSYKMNRVGFSPSEILAIRFILLVLIPMSWCFYSGSIYEISVDIILNTLIISFLSLIIPIYCSQMSILKVGPDYHSVAMGVTPFLAFIFESLFLNNKTSILVDGIFSGILFLIVAMVFYKNK